MPRLDEKQPRAATILFLRIAPQPKKPGAPFAIQSVLHLSNYKEGGTNSLEQ